MVDTPEGLQAALKPDEVACPHLSFDGVEASCAVHDRPEYKGSPCWTYGNSDVDPDFAAKRGRPCQVGIMMKSRGGVVALRPKAAEPPPVGELKTYGPWPSENSG